MATVPQTDTAQEPEPGRESRGETPTGKRGAPQAGKTRRRVVREKVLAKAAAEG